ncbi:hypothetical protein ACWGQ5_00060 [Streptomyces sp. NPDC055722]
MKKLVLGVMVWEAVLDLVDMALDVPAGDWPLQLVVGCVASAVLAVLVTVVDMLRGKRTAAS